ncbi:MAG: aminoglycoside phosphotransferase family protein [Magnetococcales bacterium]|nr:aminoglycoside phosphotransferase family protein [Magnetococcales bacterium]
MTDQNLAIQEIARHLTGQPEATLVPMGGGGNSRLMRVETPAGRFALKRHLRQAHDPRDRQKTETQALAFLHAHGVTEVPRVIAVDREHGCTLLEWIEGEPVNGATTTDVDAALALIRKLYALREVPEARHLPLASAACLSPAMLLDQVSTRMDRLFQVLPQHPELAAFVRQELLLFADQSLGTMVRHCPPDELPPALRLPSPSDFGFHNALRRPDGGIVFLDFEYFGWDDPVKLTCDFLLHPGMNLDSTLREYFANGMREICREDAEFEERLTGCLPMLGLCWCMIMLNEFLQEGWERRSFAGRHETRTVARDRQLAKARALLTWLRKRQGQETK